MRNMPGLLDKAGGHDRLIPSSVNKSTRTWEESMLIKLDLLREDLRERDPVVIAVHSEATFNENQMRLPYWGEELSILWPDLAIQNLKGKPIPTFDVAMVIYYLHTADGTAMADRWIGFRELPSGAFYNQAFQGYAGNRLAKAFGDMPDKFDEAARALDGWELPALAEHAFAFQPFPRIRLAATLWPGDEEFLTKASILFDASASHYMVTDGLALLGSGLTGRLIKKIGPPPNNVKT
jgi:hypothetical protein